MQKNIHALLVMGLLLVLSACGMNAAANPPVQRPSGTPNRVTIAIDMPTPDPTQSKRTVTLTLAPLVQQLYTTTFALPQMPQGLACTQEAGPHYTLTFQQGTKTLATIIAKDEGCKPVSITGESTNRQASQKFWGELDQAIQKAPSASSS